MNPPVDDDHDTEFIPGELLNSESPENEIKNDVQSQNRDINNGSPETNSVEKRR